MNKLYVILIAITMFSCNETPNQEYQNLQQSKVKLDANISMYSNVWDKVMNDRDINLINTDSFDSEVTVITATNNKVDLYGVTLVVMKEGKIFQEQDYFDNNVFMKQLGLME